MKPSYHNKNETNWFLNYLKHKAIILFSLVLVLTAIIIWMSLIFFGIKDYGSPYFSTSIENYHKFLLLGSWINGFLNYWFGLFSWFLPLLPLAWGYKIFS